jgi:hypothetical protein
LQASINKLNKTVATLQKASGSGGSSGGGGNQSTGGAAGGAEKRTCHHCGKKGHIKPNCPDKDKPKVEKSGQASGTANPDIKVRQAPKEGASHTKTVKGVEYKWCSTCKRWNTGDRAHLTTEHRKKADRPAEAAATTTTTTAAANLGSAEDNGGTLRLVRGMFASVGKPLKRNEVYCRVCTVVHSSDVDHASTCSHQHACCTENLQQAQNWLIVGNSKNLKDQAGQL